MTRLRREASAERSDRRVHLLVLTFFFLSGVCGLIYETVWMRLLRLVMGNTVYSVSTVLTAFMGGLSLGSYVAGRLVDRTERPLRIYGILQGGIGLYCLILPFLIAGTKPLYRVLYQNVQTSFFLLSLLRFSISFAILLVPTTMMGATLPILSKYFVDRSDRLGWTIGKLYAINTFGGMLGAFSAGFFLIPMMGVRATTYTAVLINLAIGLSVLLLLKEQQSIQEARHSPLPTPHSPLTKKPGSPIPLSPALLLVAFGGAGFASLVYEVAWTKVLALILGSSVYAFSMMLTTFIFGIGLGSIAFSKLIDRRKDLVLGLGTAELIIGVSALGVVPILGKLPIFVVPIMVRFSRSFALLSLIEFGIVFLLMVVPTTMMGVVFPLVSKLYTRSLSRIGRSVGNVYASNTLGTILGSFSAGFLLVPWLGIQRTILLAVLINVGIGLVFLFLSAWRPWKKTAVAVPTALFVALFSFWIPPWDRAILSSAPYLYAYKYERKTEGKGGLAQVMTARRKILYHKEGITATVTVTQSADELFLKVNGKTDASSKGDLRTQSLLVHLPLLLHPKPEKALLIGLGSGISLGAMEQHSVVRAIDCVEISPEVVEASRYFDAVNYHALDDPRAHLIVEDGRNHIALTRERYDVIVSQPSNLWISGMADLFTQEFFALCRKRLKEGGVMGQWVQAYLMSKRDFKSVVRTFASVFPVVSLWESEMDGDYFLIGSEHRTRIEYGTLANRMAEARVAADLARIGVPDPPSMLAGFVMTGERVKRFAQGGQLHTDDNALLEFSAPKSMVRTLYGSPDAFGLEDLEAYRSDPFGMVTGLTSPQREAVQRAYEARRLVVLGEITKAKGETSQAIEVLEQALRLRPNDSQARHALSKLIFSEAYQAMRGGQDDLAMGLYERGLAVYPDDANAYRNLGLVYERMGMHGQAMRAYRKATEIYPNFVEAYANLGLLYVKMRLYDEAIRAFQKSIELDPTYGNITYHLGNVYAVRGMYDEAAAAYEKAVEQDPRSVRVLDRLAIAYMRTGRHKEAKKTWETLLRLDSGHLNAKRRLEQLKGMGY